MSSGRALGGSGGGLGGCGGALEELWEPLYIEKLPINRTAAVMLNTLDIRYYVDFISRYYLDII